MTVLVARVDDNPVFFAVFRLLQLTASLSVGRGARTEANLSCQLAAARTNRWAAT
jgi:hypothetical protein